MIAETPSTTQPGSAPERSIRSLYAALLAAWNARQAREFAALFADEGNLIGFDGSPINGRAEIEAHLERIFADHPTAAYIGIVREIRLLRPEVAILRAAAGMVAPGAPDLNPAVNTIQTLVMTQDAGRWRIALFQNTPAAFHGRPEMAAALTEELRSALRAAAPAGGNTGSAA